MALWKELLGEMRDNARKAEGDEQTPKTTRGSTDIQAMNKAVVEGFLQANSTVKVIKTGPTEPRGEDRKPLIMEVPTRYISTSRVTEANVEASTRGTLQHFSKSSTPALDAQRAESQNAIKVEVLHSRPAKLSNAAKREAVQAALNEDSNQSDRELARRLGVSHTYIAKLRGKITGNVAESEPKVKASTGGNVSTPGELWPAMLAEVKTIEQLFERIATIDQAKTLLLNLGVVVGEKDPKWLLEAFEMMTPWTQAEMKRQRTSKRSDAKTSRRSNS